MVFGRRMEEVRPRAVGCGSIRLAVAAQLAGEGVVEGPQVEASAAGRLEEV